VTITNNEVNIIYLVYYKYIQSRNGGMWKQNTEQRPKQIKTQHNTEN